jgi:monovalent cation:H+ antiporter, CPA1 family
LRMAVRAELLLVALAIIPVVVVSRFLGVGLPLLLWQRRKRLSPAVMQAMTWGALRGGIPIALILSLPEGGVRGLMLVLTYSVVLVSMAVQAVLLARVLDEAI